MKKPKLKSPCVADRYGLPGERIAEFSIGGKGGLISLRQDGEGVPIIELYQLDPEIKVRVKPELLDT